MSKHLNRRTGDVEWHTPPELVDKIRFVLGEIDLDPASSVEANKRIRATTYYTREMDGLLYRWVGGVFLNPPYARGIIDKFIAKLIAEEGHIGAWVTLTNNSTDTRWGQQLLLHADWVCFLRGRVRFLRRNGERLRHGLQGQMVALGSGGDACMEGRFVGCFSELGVCFRAAR